MESEESKAGFTYSLALVLGLLVLVALGLLGLPVTTLILVAFASSLLGAFAYGLWDVLAHRRPRSRLRSSA